MLIISLAQQISSKHRPLCGSASCAVSGDHAAFLPAVVHPAHLAAAGGTRSISWFRLYSAMYSRALFAAGGFEVLLLRVSTEHQTWWMSSLGSTDEGDG